MELGLGHKVAVITGGSSGIGLETAVQLATEGAKVAICARDQSRLAAAASYIFEQTSQKVLTLVADVTKQQDCRQAMAAVLETYGRLDILINNAGTAQAQPFEQVAGDTWDQDLQLKLYGAIYCSKYAVAQMRQTGGGSIVNVTAISGKTPPAASLPSSVSRAAGLALTKAMSKDLGRHNIRVNAVCIGLIRSRQIEKIWQTQAPHLSWEEFSQLDRQIPLGRIGQSQEAAKVITFLASEASSYLSGTAINIDGGLAGTI